MILIDGTNLLLGRLATFVAKKALEGEKVVVVNSENVIISGKKESVLKRYVEKRERGNPLKGPYTPRRADRMLRRTIRGMIPYKTNRGINAYRKVMCHLGVPEKYENEKLTTVESANFSKLKTINYIKLGRLSKLLGTK